MINMKATHLRVSEALHINKAPSLMAIWGVMLVLGGVAQQFLSLSIDTTLIVWGVLSVIGVAGQVVCMTHGLGKNFAAWIAVIAVGWFFTLYIIKFDKGYNIQYLTDLPAIWLMLLGIGYAATAFQVNRKFWMLAAASFFLGELIEMGVYGVLQFQDFFVEYSTLLFGIFAGVPLIIASLPRFYRPAQKKPAPNQPPATPA
ncbi:MAG TPA: hypothetical protein VJ183_14895 [Chloroflexia bacterium]|nr:hypothetical protein [Chloroflexia bacterium]